MTDRRKHDRSRPHSAVKEIEEAESTPRVHLVNSSSHKQGLMTSRPDHLVRPQTSSPQRSFLPVVSSPTPGNKGAMHSNKTPKKKPTRESSSTSRRDPQTKHPPSKSSLPSLAQSHTPPGTHWAEQEEEERGVESLLLSKSEAKSKKIDQWPPSVSQSNFVEMVLAVPKTNGKLKIQVRRLREGSDGAGSSGGFGLFVHAFRLPSRAEGVLRLGDEVVSAYGVRLVDQSPKLFAKLLSDFPMGDFVELVIRRRVLSGLLPSGNVDISTSNFDHPEAVQSMQNNNQQSPTILGHASMTETPESSLKEKPPMSTAAQSAQRTDQAMPLNSDSPLEEPAVWRPRKPSEMFASTSASPQTVTPATPTIDTPITDTAIVAQIATVPIDEDKDQATPLKTDPLPQQAVESRPRRPSEMFASKKLPTPSSPQTVTGEAAMEKENGEVVAPDLPLEKATVSRPDNPKDVYSPQPAIESHQIYDPSPPVHTPIVTQTTEVALVRISGVEKPVQTPPAPTPQKPRLPSRATGIRKPSEMISLGGLNDTSIDSNEAKDEYCSNDLYRSDDRPSRNRLDSEASVPSVTFRKEDRDSFDDYIPMKEFRSDDTYADLRKKSKGDRSDSFGTPTRNDSPQATRPLTAETKTTANLFKSRAMSEESITPPPRPRPEYFTPQVQNRKGMSQNNRGGKKKLPARPHSSSSASYGRSTAAAGLTLLHNLSKQYTRAEARAEGQVLSIALKQISKSGETIVDLAARKIQLWARLTIPRKKLMRRMDNRDFVRKILFHVADRACAAGEKRVKRRGNMLQMAAAIAIQRLFRIWRRDFLYNVLRIQHAWRRAITRMKVRKLVNVVRSCLLIYRYIQKNFTKYARLSRPKRMKLLCKVMKRYFDYLGFEVRRKQQAEFLLKYQHSNLGQLSTMLQGRRRHIESSKRENAVIKIQRILRGYRARQEIVELIRSKKAMQTFRSCVMIFLIRMKTRRRVKEMAAVVKLQKRFRGMKERTNMYKRIVAGIKITQAWFKYRQYMKLKEYCRRIIRPLKITLMDIDNIPSQTIFSGCLRIKVSVWWSPLLHLMGAKDYGTVVNSKRPQYIYKTPVKPVVLSSIKKVEVPEKKKAFPSFYKVASLRLAVEKSVSLLDNEVYIGQSFSGSGKHSKPSVPFSVIRAQQDAVTSEGESGPKTNWDEVSGNGDKFENLHQNIAALPVIPRRSSLRNSNEAIIPTPLVPSLEAVAAAAASGKPSTPGEETPPQAPELSHSSSNNSDVSGSPSVMKRKVSFDATNLERVEPTKNRVPSPTAAPVVSPTNTPSTPQVSVPPVTVTSPTAHGVPNLYPNSEPALSPHNAQQKDANDMSHLNEGVEILKKNPILLRSLSRRVSRARIAAEYREEDSAEGMAAAAAEGAGAIRSMKKSPSFQKKNVRGKGAPRKSSVFGKIGDDLASLFGGDIRKSSHDGGHRPRFDSQLTMGCNFENDVVYIPGCHGNSVIKFEVMDGDRKFGSSLFHLSAHNQLMFWGGEYEQEIELYKSRRIVNLDSNFAQDSGRVSASEEQLKPVLKIKVEAGRALHSKCDWCRASFKGSGAGLGILSSFFDKWKKYYISLDGSTLRFLESKNSVDASTVINVDDIRSYRVELSGFDRNAAKQTKSAFVEDGYFFIISTASKDDVYIKFADSSIREDWEFTLDQIFERREKGSSKARRNLVSLNKRS